MRNTTAAIIVLAALLTACATPAPVPAPTPIQGQFALQPSPTAPPTNTPPPSPTATISPANDACVRATTEIPEGQNPTVFVTSGAATGCYEGLNDFLDDIGLAWDEFRPGTVITLWTQWPVDSEGAPIAPTPRATPIIPSPTPTPRAFWIRYRPSTLPLVECPDENPEEGMLESSHPGCRVTNSFWAPDGHFWGPIVKDDSGNNVDFAPVGLASCVAHYKPDPCGPDSVEQMRVFAVDDGVVRSIDYLGDKIGWRILILHEGDMIGNYGHLADPRALVHVGQAVKARQEIGSVSPSWDYFLAFSIFRKVDEYTIDYNPFDYGLAMDDLGD